MKRQAKPVRFFVTDEGRLACVVPYRLHVAFKRAVPVGERWWVARTEQAAGHWRITVRGYHALAPRWGHLIMPLSEEVKHYLGRGEDEGYRLAPAPQDEP